MSTPVLEVRRLAHAYPDGHQSLFGVDLRIERGERVALLGPNGAGKTTLVLHLNGILTPTSGSISVSGVPVSHAHLLDVRRRVGIVFQDPDDQLFMTTVAQDVAFGPRNLGLSADEVDARVEEALTDVGMLDVDTLGLDDEATPTAVAFNVAQHAVARATLTATYSVPGEPGAAPFIQDAL